MSLGVKRIINDGKIFSYDFDRYTTTQPIAHFRSDATEVKIQFHQCLKGERQIQQDRIELD